MQVPMTPSRILKRAVKLYPEKVAVVDGDIRWTYKDVEKRVYQVFHAEKAMGISPGGRVAMLDFNSYRYLELYYGMALTGDVPPPLISSMLRVRINTRRQAPRPIIPSTPACKAPGTVSDSRIVPGR